MYFGVDGDALHQYDGFVSIDDKNTSGIIYQAVGSERYLVTFMEPADTATLALELQVRFTQWDARLQKISDFQVPQIQKLLSVWA